VSVVDSEVLLMASGAKIRVLSTSEKVVPAARATRTPNTEAPVL
jgi:hypothetical protein